MTNARTRVVESILQHPGTGDPVCGQKITIRLNVGGYIDGGTVEKLGTRTVWTARATDPVPGKWSVALEVNDDIDPAGTSYTVKENGEVKTFVVQYGDGSATTLRACLVVDPANPDPLTAGVPLPGQDVPEGYVWKTDGAGSGDYEEDSGGGGAVDSVNGQTGVVVLDAGDVGADPAGAAAAVTTTSIGAATTGALAGEITRATTAEAANSTAIAAETARATGVEAVKADLVGGLVPTAQLPAIALTTAVPVANQAAMLALTTAQVQPGDVAVRADGAGTFLLMATNPAVLANWTLLNAPADLVSSVNGQTGTVVLSAANVGAATAADISTAISALTKSSVGLGNVDNTSDANKPVSTAQASALALKAPLASPALTGNPTAPTQTSGDNSTKLATTAYSDVGAAAAASNAALLTEYGQFGGAPKQPWVPAPARSSNLFTVANLYQGATLGSNTTALNKTTVTPTVTSNGAIQRLTSRLVLPVPGTDNVLGRYRLTFTLSTTTAVGNVLNLIVGPRAGGGITTLAGYSDTTVISVGPSDTPLTNFRSTYEFDYQIQSGGAGPTWLDIIISSEAASGGSITINSMDVRQIEWTTPAIWIGWDRAIASGAIINASCPAGRQADGTVMRAHRTFGPDSTLNVGLTAMTAVPESAYSAGWPKSSAAYLGNFGPQMQMHTANSGQILTVYKADGVTSELRGNTHGGETGLSGTFTTDYQLFADYQDGNGWTAITDQPWTHRCWRAKLIANTKITRSDQGSPFVIVSTTYYLYADGTCRIDRTNTFQQDQKMAHWFYHMTSIAPAARFYGKIGAGRKVHGTVDYLDKCPAPVGGTHTTATTGGTIPASPASLPWSVRVTTLTPYGESLPSTVNTAIATTGTTSTVTANWSAAPSPAGVAASGYAVYFGPAGFERYVGQVGAGVTTLLITAVPLGTAASPPTSNTAVTGSQTTGSQTDGPFADWSAIFDPYTKMVLSLAVDRDTILSHTGVTGIRGTLIEAVGICKNYWHLTFTGDGGGFPYTVPSGQVFTDTLWFFAYMPASLKEFESEQTVRAANVKNLGSLYPVT